MGGALATTGGMAALGYVGGGVVGVPKSVLPSLINTAQGEDSQYTDYIGDIAGSAAIGGTLGAAAGYMAPADFGATPKGIAMSIGDRLDQKADSGNRRVRFENASGAGKRRAGAMIGGAAIATGAAGAQTLMNLINSLHNATPEEVAQMVQS